MRTITKVLLTGSIALLLLAVALMAFLAWELRPRPPTSALPALVRNLPGSLVTDIKKAFHQRVREKFANGVASDVLAAQLQREGFTVRRQTLYATGDIPIFFASVEQHGGMCVTDWSIWWRRDAQGRAQDIDGRLDYTCP